MPELRKSVIHDSPDRRHETEMVRFLHDAGAHGSDDMRKVIISLMAWIAIASAQAAEGPAFMNGNKLSEYCRNLDGVCVGYVTGIADYVSEQEDRTICIPLTSTPEQLVAVVNKWLKDNPQYLHYAAGTLVEAALYQAFKCK